MACGIGTPYRGVWLRAVFAAMHKVAQQHPCSVYSVIEKLKEYAPSSTPHEDLDGIHDRFLQCGEFDLSLVRCEPSPSHMHGPTKSPLPTCHQAARASTCTRVHHPYSSQLKAELWRVAGRTACRRALTSLLYGYALCSTDRGMGGRVADRLFTDLHNDPDIFADGWDTRADAAEEVKAGRLAAREATRREEKERKLDQEAELKVSARVREASSRTLSTRTRRALGSGGGGRSVVGVCIAGSGGDGARFEVAALVRVAGLEGPAKAPVTVGAVVVWLSLYEALFARYIGAATAAVTVGAAVAAARAEEARLLRFNRLLYPLRFRSHPH